MNPEMLFKEIPLSTFESQMESTGWFLFEEVVDDNLIAALRTDLEEAYEIRRPIQIKNGVESDTAGTAHHLPADGKSFIEFLKREYLDEYIRAYFQGNYILNAFGGSQNLRSQVNYANRIHRDVRTYTVEMKLLLNMLVMLDDFTVENGATYLLSGSHLKKQKPVPEEFFPQAYRAIAKSGSILFWDSNVWHAAGENKTELPRRALSLIFSRPFMKQQFDYPRSIGYDYLSSCSENFRQVIGFNARVPTTLSEWYQPPEKRFYRPGQG